jgi:Tol biopolymer transport system component
LPVQEHSPSTPYPPPVDPSSGAFIEETSEAAIEQSPCVFASEPVEDGERIYSIDDFVFSDPQIILTQTEDINLISWLPDNQQVLITRYIQKPEAMAGGQIRFRDQIELLDINSGKSVILADRNGFQNTQPVWVPTQNMVLFIEIYRPNPDRPDILSRRVMVSQGDSAKTEIFADNLAGGAVAASPSEDNIAYLVNGDIELLNLSNKENQQIALKARLKNGEESGISISKVPYETAWRPGSSQVILYNRSDVRVSRRLLFIDLKSGMTCKVDLTDWAGTVKWSPDGRYFAIAQILGRPGSAYGSDLVVYDVVTGHRFQTKFTLPDEQEPNVITDIEWAPDNRHLAVVVKGQLTRHLYLLDFIQNEKKSIMSPYEFGGGELGSNLLWSPDGTMLLGSCPTEKAERLCLITVKMPSIP